MKCASIDIGTNTLRLLIAEVDASGALNPLIYRRAITRLGGSFTEKAGIDRLAAGRTFAVLEEFQRVITEVGIDCVLAAATSVVRRARNRDWFLNEVKERTGIDVSVIPGDEEARLSLIGVLSVLNDTSSRRLVIDIGGGSTEFIATRDSGIAGAWSMEMGVVHLTERHLISDPPKTTELGALEEEILGVIAELKGLMNKDTVDPSAYSGDRGAVFVGTAGTVTTLAALDQGLEIYDRSKINNYPLAKDRIKKMYEYLTSLTLRERQSLLNLEKGREDLIIPGAAITLKVMESFGFDELKVSDAGLLEGIILKKTGTLRLSERAGKKAEDAEV